MRTEIETAGSGKGLGSILRFKYRTSPQQGDNSQWSHVVCGKRGGFDMLPLVMHTLSRYVCADRTAWRAANTAREHTQPRTALLAMVRTKPRPRPEPGQPRRHRALAMADADARAFGLRAGLVRVRSASQHS